MYRVVPLSSQTMFRTFPSSQDVLLCPFTVRLTPPCSPKLSYSLLLWVSLFWTLHVGGIVQYVVFRVWFLLLSVMWFRFINAVPCISIYSLSLLNSILLWAYATFCLSFHQAKDIWIVSSSELLWIILLWLFAYKSFKKLIIPITL